MINTFGNYIYRWLHLLNSIQVESKVVIVGTNLSAHIYWLAYESIAGYIRYDPASYQIKR